MAKQHRAQNDIFAKLGQDELLITNFPSGLVSEFDSEAKVADFLIKTVHKDL